MKKAFFVLVFAALMLTACFVTSGHRGEVGIVIAPPLPPVVELEFPDAFYFYNDYYYHYRDNDWYYSRSQSGPWNNLPRDRHPREVRYKNRGGDRDGGNERGGGGRQGHEQHDRD